MKTICHRPTPPIFLTTPPGALLYISRALTVYLSCSLSTTDGIPDLQIPSRHPVSYHPTTIQVCYDLLPSIISDLDHWYFILLAYLREDVYPLHLSTVLRCDSITIRYALLDCNCCLRTSLLHRPRGRKILAPLCGHRLILYVRLTNMHRVVARATSETVYCLLRVAKEIFHFTALRR